MTRRTGRRVVFGSILILGLCTIALFATRVWEAQRSCQTFETFCGHIRAGEWSAARSMVDSKPEWFRVEDGAVYYWDYDTTAAFLRAEPLFQETLRYYVLDRHMGDKVIFAARSGGNYARLENGKITYVKIP